MKKTTFYDDELDKEAIAGSPWESLYGTKALSALFFAKVDEEKRYIAATAVAVSTPGSRKCRRREWKSLVVPVVLELARREEDPGRRSVYACPNAV